MKNLVQKFTLSVFAAFVSLFALAQDGKALDVDIDVDKGGDWYLQPWVWVVGGAIFILLLVAMLRSGKK